MRTNSLNLALNAAVLLAVFLLASCGDTVENQINQTGMDVVASEDDLPECSDDNEGEQAVVKGESSIRVCIDGDWVAMNGSGSGDFSCKTEELKDKSGLKIICNGDSIGVILNGADGKDGKDGLDGKDGKNGKDGEDGVDGKNGEDGSDGKDGEVVADTAVLDSEALAVSLDSLAGYSQKGPFLKGSTVYLYELSDGRTLKQTSGNFTSSISRDDGYYKFNARDLVSQYALIVVDGHYRNEVTGRNSETAIKLKAISDVHKHSTGANVNILTHLEYERVYYLVTKKKMTVSAAKRQAQREILKQFNIELDGTTDSENMDVFGDTDADAALLAISILLQGNRSEADMSALLTEISNDMAQDGEWDEVDRSETFKSEIADWALQADSDTLLKVFRKHVKDWNLGGDTTVPDFEKYVRNYINIMAQLGECTKDNEGAFVHVPNPKSKYFAHAYDSIDATRNSLARFVCDSRGGYHWRRMIALERDTLGWNGGKTGEMRSGRIDTSLIYIYDGGWRHGTDLDIRLKKACVKSKVNEVQALVQGKDTLLYKCTDGLDLSYDGSTWTLAWAPANDNEFEKFFFETHRDSLGAFIKGPITGKVMVWEADTLREPTQKEIPLGRSCVTEMRGKKYKVPIGLVYECTNSGWSKTGVFSNGGDEYKATVIGDQIWMAENLRILSLGKYREKDHFYCRDKNLFSDGSLACYYSWAMAVDSLGYFSEGGKGCGNGKQCGNRGRIRGICPEGWHLPSSEEWSTLLTAAGGISNAPSHLKAVTGWNRTNGIDSYGFALEAYGAWDSAMHGLDATINNGNAVLWCSDDKSNGYAYYVRFEDEGNSVRIDENSKMYTLMNVRCVKD